ncbi:hypothetical protein ACFOU2_02040 [Bacillus songklensis]|uniref:Uncharacterized protein n=1 Tax=Bacillus songklensis TaxID=1069116 RepID=A0ABV8AWK3_9BACI
MGKISSIDTQTSQSKIDRSGNSDVDVTVNVQVDTTAIAFAMLYSLLMTKQISNKECELAVRQLKDLINKNKKSSSGKENDYIPKNKRPEIVIESPLKKKRPEMKIEYPPKR